SPRASPRLPTWSRRSSPGSTRQTVPPVGRKRRGMGDSSAELQLGGDSDLEVGATSSTPLVASIGLVMALPEEARPVARAMRGACWERVVVSSEKGLAMAGPLSLSTCPSIVEQVSGARGGQAVVMAWSGAGA